MRIRINFVVHGHVQGVAFRHYTRLMASELGLTGWVRNLPDGSVAGMAEGEETAVNALVDWLHEGPPAAYVERVETRRGEYGGKFDDFRVAF